MEHNNSIFISQADWELQFSDLFSYLTTPEHFVAEIVREKTGGTFVYFRDPYLIRRPMADTEYYCFIPTGIQPLLLKGILRKPAQIGFLDDIDRNFIFLGADTARKQKISQLREKISRLEAKILELEAMAIDTVPGFIEESNGINQSTLF